MIHAASIPDLFALPGVQRSAWALLVAGLALPIVGVLIIGLEVITVRFAVMHTALLGIALGLWWGIAPYGMALGLCALLGLVLSPLASHPGGLAGPMSFAMTITAAAALLVLSISGVNANGAFEVLWGSILATRPVDLGTLVLVAVIVAAMYGATRKRLALLLFDRELAACSGVPVVALTAVALLVVCISIGSAIRLTGALLVDSVTILPALAARNLATSFGSMVVIAIAFGLVGNALGFIAALHFDQPPGPMLVLAAGALTLATYLPRRRSPLLSTH